MPLVNIFCTPPDNTDYNRVIRKGITDALSQLRLCQSDPARIYFNELDTAHFSRGGVLLQEQGVSVTPETSSYYVEVNLASGSSMEQRKAVCGKVTDIIAGCGIPRENIAVTVLEYPAGSYMVGGTPV
jgi:phenylpyruvate tautomerase PptA (4-oxalocrotonate tautomerase family)